MISVLQLTNGLMTQQEGLSQGAVRPIAELYGYLQNAATMQKPTNTKLNCTF